MKTDLKDRTFHFSLDVIDLVEQLQKKLKQQMSLHIN
jgi:hypothetical protein